MSSTPPNTLTPEAEDLYSELIMQARAEFGFSGKTPPTGSELEKLQNAFCHDDGQSIRGIKLFNDIATFMSTHHDTLNSEQREKLDHHLTHLFHLFTLTQKAPMSIGKQRFVDAGGLSMFETMTKKVQEPEGKTVVAESFANLALEEQHTQKNPLFKTIANAIDSWTSDSSQVERRSKHANDLSQMYITVSRETKEFEQLFSTKAKLFDIKAQWKKVGIPLYQKISTYLAKNKATLTASDRVSLENHLKKLDDIYVNLAGDTIKQMKHFGDIADNFSTLLENPSASDALNLANELKKHSGQVKNLLTELSPVNPELKASIEAHYEKLKAIINAHAEKLEILEATVLAHQAEREVQEHLAILASDSHTTSDTTEVLYTRLMKLKGIITGRYTLADENPYSALFKFRPQSDAAAQIKKKSLKQLTESYFLLKQRRDELDRLFVESDYCQNKLKTESDLSKQFILEAEIAHTAIRKTVSQRLSAAHPPITAKMLMNILAQSGRTLEYADSINPDRDLFAILQTGRPSDSEWIKNITSDGRFIRERNYDELLTAVYNVLKEKTNRTPSEEQLFNAIKIYDCLGTLTGDYITEARQEKYLSMLEGGDERISMESNKLNALVQGYQHYCDFIDLLKEQSIPVDKIVSSEQQRLRDAILTLASTSSDMRVLAQTLLSATPSNASQSLAADLSKLPSLQTQAHATTSPQPPTSRIRIPGMLKGLLKRNAQSPEREATPQDPNVGKPVEPLHKR